MLAVIRDKDTKQMRVMWDTQDDSGGPAESDIGPNDEFVYLPNMTHQSVLAVARQQVGRNLGIVRVHDDRVEADVRPPKPTIAGTIRATRAASNRPLDAPVSLDEIEAAERTLNSGR